MSRFNSTATRSDFIPNCSTSLLSVRGPSTVRSSPLMTSFIPADLRKGKAVRASRGSFEMEKWRLKAAMKSAAFAAPLKPRPLQAADLQSYCGSLAARVQASAGQTRASAPTRFRRYGVRTHSGDRLEGSVDFAEAE